MVDERSPLEGDEVVGSGFPDPDVTEHLIWESRWSIRFNLGGERIRCACLGIIQPVLELKSKWEELELATLLLSHFSLAGEDPAFGQLSFFIRKSFVKPG